MNIQLNGEQKEIAANQLSINELLKYENVTQPEMVSVQKNGEFVNRSDFESILVNDGDEVDFLYFMGGGQNSVNKIPNKLQTWI